MRNRLVLWRLFRGGLRSRELLRHIRHWTSRKPLDIQTWFQRTTNRKWLIENVTQKGQTRDPNMLWAQYLENSWTCYLETIANCYISAVRQYDRYPSDSSCFLSCCILYVLDHILSYCIRFLDLENVCLDTKVMCLWCSEADILPDFKTNSRHFENLRWRP